MWQLKQIKTLFKSTSFKVVSLILVLFSMAMTVGILGYPYVNTGLGVGSIEPYGSFKLTNPVNYVKNITQTWDANHYLFLSQNGYSNDENLRFRFAFFPFFPAESGLVNIITRHPKASLYFTSVLNTLVFAYLSFLLLKTLSKKFEIEDKIFPIVLTMFLMPFTLYYFLPYTESLFNGLVVALLLVLEKNKTKSLWLGIPICFVLALTRSVGMYSVIITGVYLLYNIFEKTTEDKKTWIQKIFNIKNTAYVLMMFAAVAGLLSFLSYGKMTTGNFWISKDVQSIWGRSRQRFDVQNLIFDNFTKALNPEKSIPENCGGNRWCYNGAILFPAISIFLFILSLVLVLYFYRKHKIVWATALFSFVLFVTPLTTDNMESFYRYVITTPIYFLFFPILLNSKLDRDWMMVVTVCLAMAQGVLLMLFANMHWLV